MNTTIKLSVSSVLLAGLMTGCSQQQFQGGGQQLAGGSQVAGGQQILGGGQSAGGQQILGGGQSAGGQQILGGGQSAGGQQILGGQQSAGGGQSAGGQQVLGGQQQSANSRVDTQIQDLVAPRSTGIDSQVRNLVAPTNTHLHDTAQSTEHLHNVKPQQRVYVPLPESMKERAPAVFMYDQPKPVKQAEPIYYGTAKPEPVYYEQAAQTLRRPAPAPARRAKPIPRHKPVVRHAGIGMPPAQPGQCFAKVKTPAKFRNIVELL